MTSKSKDPESSQVIESIDDAEKTDSPRSLVTSEQIREDDTISVSETGNFDDFDELWAAADPVRAPRLLFSRMTKNDCQESVVETEQSGTSSPTINIPADATPVADVVQTSVAEVSDANISHASNYLDASDKLPAVPLDILPFHHLVPSAPLAPVLTQITSPPIEQAGAISRIKQKHIEANRQLCWQQLTANGISAHEAALFDDALHCRLHQYFKGRLTEIDWTVTYFNALAGCAEIYRAELLFWKRRVYESGDDLRTFLEIKESDLLTHFTGTALRNLSDKYITQLFLDSLNAKFLIDVRSASVKNLSAVLEANLTIQQRTSHFISTSGLFDDYHSTNGERIGFWIGSGDEGLLSLGDSKDGAVHSVGRVFRLELKDYWLHWRRAARVATFDFDYLKTISDARSLRFYELTKLWRVYAGNAAASSLSAEMKIDYEAFAALLPVPVVYSQRNIKSQITDIVKPLENNGYVRSFTLRGDSPESSARNPLLTFRFND